MGKLLSLGFPERSPQATLSHMTRINNANNPRTRLFTIHHHGQPSQRMAAEPWET